MSSRRCSPDHACRISSSLATHSPGGLIASELPLCHGVRQHDCGLLTDDHNRVRCRFHKPPEASPGEKLPKGRSSSKASLETLLLLCQAVLLPPLSCFHAAEKTTRTSNRSPRTQLLYPLTMEIVDGLLTPRNAADYRASAPCHFGRSMQWRCRGTSSATSPIVVGTVRTRVRSPLPQHHRRRSPSGSIPPARAGRTQERR